ncbi:MAG: twin-arginine translocation signal domain-containing protein, partial [Bacteroidales bacterium]|nr:twin-arginine translocation signal domain-containing protein [Bacteroidales bacterium]
MDRRKFFKVTAAAGVAAGLASCSSNFSSSKVVPYQLDSKGKNRLSLRYFPYELQLAHTFTVATYSRTTTPDVQVELEYDGFIGYGEASMPPYLGHTVESVCAFLDKVDLGQFSDPFKIEEILSYVDSLSDGDAPAKAAIDIALHDLVGKLLGQPLYRIWGYDPAKAGPTCFTIG